MSEERVTYGVSPIRLILPDKSEVFFDADDFLFSKRNDFNASKKLYSLSDNIDVGQFIEYLTNPKYDFSSCFRRINDAPRYSPVQSTYQFDIMFVNRLFKLPGDYRGGTFSSSQTQAEILDGRLISHIGYGWGSHSWTVLEGFEVLRMVCLFFGIKQPRRLKGEKKPRLLADILIDLNHYPIDPKALR